MDTFQLVYKIVPVAAARPKVTRWSNYYPKTYQRFREAMEALITKDQHWLLPGPLKMDITFFIKIAKSHSKKKRAELCGQFCSGRPDLDNLEKAIYDAMSGKVYLDDGQIVEHSTRKVWSDDPRIVIAITPVK